MLHFLMFLAMAATAYFAWRIMDQLPDVVFRLSEIQRDIAEIRRHMDQPPAGTDEGDDDQDDAGS